MQTDEDGAQRAFLQEQIGLLRTIAKGASKHEVLLELTRAADRLQPGLRSCILLANPDLTAVAESATGDFPAAFSQAIAGAPINDIPFGTCGAAVHGQQPVGCADIEHATVWAPQWR